MCSVSVDRHFFLDFLSSCLLMLLYFHLFFCDEGFFICLVAVKNFLANSCSTAPASINSKQLIYFDCVMHSIVFV